MKEMDTKVLKKLVNVEKYLFKAKNRKEVFKRIAKEAVSLLSVDIASIFGIDYEDMTLHGESGYGMDERNIEKIKVPLSFSKTALEAFETKKPVMVVDVKKQKAIPKEFVKKYDFRSSLTVPLIGTEKKVLGFLFLDIVGRPKEFTPEEKVIAECFANLATIAIEQVKLKQNLEKTVSILYAYNEIATLPFHNMKLRSVMKVFLENLISILAMDAGLVELIEKEELVVKSSVGTVGKFSKDLRKMMIGMSIADKVVKTGRTIIIEDVGSDKRIFSKAADSFKARSLICVPLVIEEEVKGVLTVISRKKRRFSRDSINYIENASMQLGVIIENTMLFEKMNFSNRKIKTLLELNRSIVAILDLELLYKKVLDGIPSIIPSYSSYIMLIDKESDELTIVARKVPGRYSHKQIRIKVGEGITGSVAKTGKAIMVPDVKKHKGYIEKLKEIKSEIAVPLAVKGKVIGVLNFESNDLNAYKSQDVEILTAFANEMAIAIENARLYQEFKERTLQLELINRVMKETGKRYDINALCRKLCEVIQGNFYYDHTLLFLLDEKGENVILKGYAGLPYEIQEFHQNIKNGLFGQCVRTKKSVLVNNTKENKVFISELPKEETALSELDIPILSGDSVLGVLALQSRTQDAFSEWDIVAMETISEHIASSLDNAKLYSDLRYRISELSSLYEIGIELSSSRNIDELLDKMYISTREFTKAGTFYVALLNKRDNTVRFAVNYEEGKKKKQEVFSLDELKGYTGWILNNDQPILIGNLQRERKKYPVKPILDGLNMLSYLGVPIKFKNRVIGVLSMQSPEEDIFDSSTLNLFTTFANQLGVVIENARLFTEMHTVLSKLERSYDETLKSLISALDFRERETQYHSLRVALFAVELAKRFDISKTALRYIYWGGILHDIGKIGVADSILLKPSSLTPEEWNEIKKHPEIGYIIVKEIEFVKNSNDIILFHHEWWNGSGYPYGKKGTNIPLYARIFSVVDALDSMTSKRPYKKAVSFEDARKEIQRCSGTQFDPQVVDIFSKVPLNIWKRIKKIKPFTIKFEIPKVEKLK